MLEQEKKNLARRRDVPLRGHPRSILRSLRQGEGSQFATAFSLGEEASPGALAIPSERIAGDRLGVQSVEAAAFAAHPRHRQVGVLLFDRLPVLILQIEQFTAVD
jgi:hypothetical protein